MRFYWMLLFLAVWLCSWLGEGSSGPPLGEEGGAAPDEARHTQPPLLVRKKRHFIWNSLYVEEEKNISVPDKIGELISSSNPKGRYFKIEGEGANSIFTVDHNGDLFVNQRLDREEKAEYRLTASMYDITGRLLEPPDDFKIKVKDINDHIPFFTQPFNAFVMERAPIGTSVMTVNATDLDDPTTANGDLRYSLRPEGETRAFQIDRETGKISTASSPLLLDREKTSLYVLVVQAKDNRGLQTGSTATASISISLLDLNDNQASFTTPTYEFSVLEDMKLDHLIGCLEVKDLDEKDNKDPDFSITGPFSSTFNLQPNSDRNGDLTLKTALDYEKKNSYSFSVHLRENGLISPPDNRDAAMTKATVLVKVLDVDEPPEFSQQIYSFKVQEETIKSNIGHVTAWDPDRANKSIRYFIEDKNCPISINPISGQLSTKRKLDREWQARHLVQVHAQEEPSGLRSFVNVNILVLDINDNKPELDVEDIFVCENDMPGTVIGTLTANDTDEQTPHFSFYLTNQNANFSVIDNKDNTAEVRLIQGRFSVDDPRDFSLEVGVSDGGHPPQTSSTHLPIKVCRCDARRAPYNCKAAAVSMGVSVQALLAILLCILTILVIVILIVLRRRFQKEALSGLKSSGEIHEQLVSYDEEGGGEMDTNGYDVSILTSACQEGPRLRTPDCGPARPSLYASVQKAPLVAPACKGDMAAMIEVKKDEADGDGEGVPYDTLHIYGYEGPGSLAGSLSSLDSSSSSASLEYDFLSDWGPRFRPLAELYGVEGPQRCAPY